MMRKQVVSPRAAQTRTLPAVSLAPAGIFSPWFPVGLNTNPVRDGWYQVEVDGAPGQPYMGYFCNGWSVIKWVEADDKSNSFLPSEVFRDRWRGLASNPGATP